MGMEQDKSSEQEIRKSYHLMAFFFPDLNRFLLVDTEGEQFIRDRSLLIEPSEEFYWEFTNPIKNSLVFGSDDKEAIGFFRKHGPQVADELRSRIRESGKVVPADGQISLSLTPIMVSTSIEGFIDHPQLRAIHNELSQFGLEGHLWENIDELIKLDGIGRN